MARLIVRTKAYKTEKTAADKIRSATIQYPDLNNITTVVLVQDGGFHPAMLPTQDQLQDAINLAQTTGMLVLRR